MIDFAAVEASVADLKKQLNQGEITQETFEQQMLTLIDVAEDGHYWMYGHKTGQWYRHTGDQWVAGNPDDIEAFEDNRLAFLVMVL